MDPQATLWALLDAIDSNDREGACDYMEYLTEWIKKGGHMPEVHRTGVNDLFQVRLRG